MKLAAIIAGFALLAPAAGKRADMDGVWILLGTNIEKPQLTPEAEKKRAAYDYQKDDPDFQCKPASVTRVMHTPSPPIEVRQHPDYVEVNYEFMDVRRHVPLKKGLAAKDAPYAAKRYPHLGKSVAQYDGENLVIETVGQKAGILDTLGSPGLYQSDQMRTVETFIPNGNRLQVTVTHYDPYISRSHSRSHTTTSSFLAGKSKNGTASPRKPRTSGSGNKTLCFARFLNGISGKPSGSRVFRTASPGSRSAPAFPDQHLGGAVCFSLFVVSLEAIRRS